MKKILAIAIMLLSISIGMRANSIRYFTYSQVSRTVAYLNSQNELMIYCGYADEIETYVILSEVWAEKINSKYYEVWIFGYDAYTGEEIYMPIDLECIWLYSNSGSIYSAAQYLRFHTTAVRPQIVWVVPQYNSFTRVPHVVGHARTYHWDVHQYGWTRPDPVHFIPGTPPPPQPYHPYYLRRPGTPVIMPTQIWTPGVTRPNTTVKGYEYAGGGRNGDGSSRRTTNSNNGSSSQRGTTSSNGTSSSSQRGTTTNNGATTQRGTSSNNGATTQRGTTTSTSSSAQRGTTTNNGTTTQRGTSANNGATTQRGTTTSTSSSAQRGTTSSNGTTTQRGTSSNNGTTTQRGTTTNTSSSAQRGTTSSNGTTTQRGTTTATPKAATTTTTQRGSNANASNASSATQRGSATSNSSQRGTSANTGSSTRR